MDTERLEQERAMLYDLLTEIGNELLMADETGAFYAEQGERSFMHNLAKKLNQILL